MFQFQIGAIRGLCVTPQSEVEILFQFQIGAIRGFGLGCPKFGAPSRFNSKLVRLEGKCLRRALLLQTGFNSKLVRLEGV